MRRLLALSVVVGLLIVGAIRYGIDPRQPSRMGASPAVETPAPDEEGGVAQPPAPPADDAREPVPAVSVEPEPREETVAIVGRDVGPALDRMPRSSLAGRVLQSDGAPVGGAEVAVEADVPWRSELGPLATSETTKDGTFRLTCPGTGPFRVMAVRTQAKGLTTQNVLEGVIGGSQDLEVVLPGPCSVQGRVVDDLGRPIRKFSIVSRIAEPGLGTSGSFVRQSFRDEDGAFRFESLSSGALKWRVLSLEDFADEQLEVTLPAREPLTIVLERLATVRGVVLDPEGKPLPDASVSAPGSRRIDRGPFRRAGGGTFDLRCAPGPVVELQATCKEFMPSEHVALDLEPGEVVEGVVLRLRPRARITGEVVGLDGRPVAGRDVSIRRDYNSNTDSTPYMSDPWSKTDDSGRFEAALTAGSFWLSVDLSEEEIRAFELRSGQQGIESLRCERLVTLGPGDSAHVRLDLVGSPVRLHGRLTVDGSVPEDAMVRAWCPGASSVMATLDDGRYEALLPRSGVHHLVAHVGDTNYTRTVDVPDIENFRFDFSIALGRLSGRVTDESGRPVAGMEILATSDLPFGSYGSGRTITDERGAYQLVLEAGTHRVFPSPDSTEDHFLAADEQFVVVEAGATRTAVDFLLREIPGIEGLVLRSDGRAAAHARVSATLEGVDVSWSRTDEDGRFEMRNLQSGVHSLTAAFEGGPEWQEITPQPLPARVLPTGVRFVELHLVQAVMVRVRLVNGAGTQVRARLEAVDTLGRTIAASQENGVYHFALVPPGPFLLRAKQRERLHEREFSLDGPMGVLDVEFRLE